MRLLLFTLLLISSVSLNAQSKSEILNELDSIVKEHCTTLGLRDAEIFYNSEEKIFDFGSRYQYDLNDTKITYETEYEKHFLVFARKTDTDSGQQLFSFDSKKSVYEVIDLIYLLKKIE